MEINMEANIISYLKRTTESSEKPTYFSTKQHFIKPMLNSGVHNLEEQLLLGMNKITKKWVENGVNIEYTEFRKDEDDSRYYVLDSRIYGVEGGSPDSEVYISSDTIVFLDEDFQKPGPVVIDGETLVDEPNDSVIMAVSNNTLSIRAPFVEREDTLKFCVDEGEETRSYLVAKKVTSVKFETVNGIETSIIEEKVTQYDYEEISND